jgi:nitroreductase
MDSRLRLIFSRRSIRQYTSQPVTEDDITGLLQAAMAAPSGSNRKPWHFVVVTDRATLQDLAAAHPYGKMLAHAPVAIAVCGVPATSKWWVQDCSAATENILLGVTSLGLGGVWVGCYGAPDRERAVARILEIPHGIRVLSLISIGHPGEAKEPRTQHDPARVHTDRW